MGRSEEPDPYKRGELVSRCGNLIAIVVLVSLAAVTVAWAVPTETIHLLTHPFNPADGEPVLDSWLKAEPPAPGEAGYYLVQLAGTSTPERKAAVEALGGELIAYVPDDTWIARIDGDRSAALLASPDVAWVGAFHPAYKISPTIGTHEFKNPKRAGDSFLTLRVRVFDDLAGTALAVERLGLTCSRRATTGSRISSWCTPPDRWSTPSRACPRSGGSRRSRSST